MFGLLEIMMGGRYIILQKKVLQINQIALLEQNGQLGV
jgi:hypothetical protein